MKVATDLAWAPPWPGLISSRAMARILGGPEASCASTAEADRISVPRTPRRRSMGPPPFGMGASRYAPGARVSTARRATARRAGSPVDEWPARLAHDADARQQPPHPAHREEEHAQQAQGQVGAAVEREAAGSRPGDDEPGQPGGAESEADESEGRLPPAGPASGEQRAEAGKDEEVRHQARPGPRLVHPITLEPSAGRPHCRLG